MGVMRRHGPVICAGRWALAAAAAWATIGLLAVAAWWVVGCIL